MRKWLRTTSVLVLVQLLLVAWAGVATSGNDGEERPQASLILNVGFQGDLLARNYLRNRDRLTSGILDPVYDPVGKLEPKTEEPIPYLLKGVDADESGTFDLDEYGIYVKDVGTDILEVTAHYDFNGVLSHDGVQMTMDDLLFSYHIAALSPMRGDIDVVKDKNGLPGSNYTTSRWLNVWPVTDVWDPNIPVGPDASLTFALHFSQQAPYTGFVKHTLNAITLMPRHIWEGTGKVCLDATNGICNNWKQNIHTDFGHAYDEVTHNGIPAVDPSSFEYWKAESWLPGDDEVIGTGPFEFDVWVPGVSTRIVRFDDYKVDVLGCVRTGAPPACNGDFFSYLHKPYVDEIFFKIYKTVVACAFAMQADEIQYIGSSLTPELLPPLQSDPTIGVELTANKGFGHLGYNMRMSP
ncbi:MAG: ABC transporter substrate-binding protein, partial [Thermoplasmata archaeon]